MRMGNVAASLLLLAAAGCASDDRSSSRPPSRSDQAGGGVADIPAPPAPEPPKTLDEHSSGVLGLLAEIVDTILHVVR